MAQIEQDIWIYLRFVGLVSVNQWSCEHFPRMWGTNDKEKRRVFKSLIRLQWVDVVCLKEELFRMSNLSSWVSMYLSEGSLSLFDVLGLVCCFFFLFFCLYSAATCILHVYFVHLFQMLLVYLFCLPIKKKKY